LLSTRDPNLPRGNFHSRSSRRDDKSLRNCRRSPPDAAYVSYAPSGTTGFKGTWPVGHRQMILYAVTCVTGCKLSATDVVCPSPSLHLASGVCTVLHGPRCWEEFPRSAFLNRCRWVRAALDEYRLTWLTTGFTFTRSPATRNWPNPGSPARSACVSMRSRVMAPRSGLSLIGIETGFRSPLLVALHTMTLLQLRLIPPALHAS